MRESYERARPLGGLPPHSQPFAGDPDGTPAEQAAFSDSRRNFLALMFCLMVGTAGLPHLLTRYYTTPIGGRGAHARWPGRCSSSRCCTSARRRWRCW